MHLSAQSRTIPSARLTTTPCLGSPPASGQHCSSSYGGFLFQPKQPVHPTLVRWLGAALLAVILTGSTYAQSSVTLAWDPDTDNTVAGYRLYEGVVSRTYTNVIDVGNAATVTVSNLVWGVTYYFAVTAYDTNGEESALSDEISFTVPFPTNTALTFAADSGTFTDPFTDSAGALSQSMTTGVTDGGRGVYNFNILQAGDYLVTAMVIAPSLSEDTFYVNVDAEPTDPLMIWDIPVCSTSTSRTVSWRGNGDPAADQYSPKVFTLGVGPHQLIIRGQDANTTLGTISIVAVPPAPMLSISLASSGSGTPSDPAAPSQASVVMSVTGLAGQTYTILSSDDLETWTAIGTVTLDASGSAQSSDPEGISHPSRMYRLQGSVAP